MSLPVVLVGGRGLLKGEMVKNGWEGVPEGARDGLVWSSC